jgi:ATP-binding cassette subfamily C exporter for protease/lipase
MNLRKLPTGGLQPLQDLQVLRDMFHGPAVRAAMEMPVAAVFPAIVFAIHPLLGWVTLLGAVLQAGLAWGNERGTHAPMVTANRAASSRPWWR